jgi:hypothetical protein
MNNIPDGYPTAEDDPTGLRLDIGTKDGVVIINFSKPVVVMHLNPLQVRSMAIALLQNAEMALGQTLPLPPSRIP